jgi:TonB family protein
MLLLTHITLSRRERQIMDILYQRARATAAEIHEAPIWTPLPRRRASPMRPESIDSHSFLPGGTRSKSRSWGPRSTPQRIRIGGNVQATKLITQVKPIYPESAQQQGIEGTVLLKAVIATDGSLLSVGVLNTLANPELAAAVMDAVKQWRYQPTLLNGVPVEVVTTISVNYRLQK